MCFYYTKGIYGGWDCWCAVSKEFVGVEGHPRQNFKLAVGVKTKQLAEATLRVWDSFNGFNALNNMLEAPTSEV